MALGRPSSCCGYVSERKESKTEKRCPMKFLRLSEVLDRTGLSKTTLYSLMRQYRFPQSIPISDRSVAWSEEDVDAWLQEKMQMRDVNRTNQASSLPKRQRPQPSYSGYYMH